MTVEYANYSTQFNGSVRVLVTSNNSKSMPLIPIEEYKAALLESLRHSNLFEEIKQHYTADYELVVVLKYLAIPGYGLDMESRLVSQWSLININNEKEILRDLITSTGIATFEDSFVGASRGRIAISRSAKETIRRGLDELSRIANTKK